MEVIKTTRREVDKTSTAKTPVFKCPFCDMWFWDKSACELHVYLKHG